MRELTHRTKQLRERKHETAQPQQRIDPLEGKRFKLSYKNPLLHSGYAYNKSARGKGYLRASQAVEGRAWNYYRLTGRDLPMIEMPRRISTPFMVGRMEEIRPPRGAHWSEPPKEVLARPYGARKMFYGRVEEGGHRSQAPEAAPAGAPRHPCAVQEDGAAVRPVRPHEDRTLPPAPQASEGNPEHLGHGSAPPSARTPAAEPEIVRAAPAHPAAYEPPVHGPRAETADPHLIPEGREPGAHLISRAIHVPALRHSRSGVRDPAHPAQEHVPIRYVAAPPLRHEEAVPVLHTLDAPLHAPRQDTAEQQPRPASDRGGGYISSARKKVRQLKVAQGSASADE